MPPWSFVPQNCVARRQRIRSPHLGFLQGIVKGSFTRPWAIQWANHPSWTSWFQKVELVRDLPNLKVACWNLGAYLFACKAATGSTYCRLCTTVWWLAIIDCKIGAKKIRAANVLDKIRMSKIYIKGIFNVSTIGFFKGKQLMEFKIVLI